jgi:uncharacterized protein YfbU (UPF0304 family)
MKYTSVIKMVLTALLMTVFINSNAQTSASVESTVDEIVKKHEASKGVSCMKVVKGGGLELVKMMLKKEFGKDFMKGVTCITVIDYSEASEETCTTLHKDLDAFLSLLQEFDVSKEKQFADNDYIRCFASATESDTLSDFVIALENDESKMIMYMAGKIVFKE